MVLCLLFLLSLIGCWIVADAFLSAANEAYEEQKAEIQTLKGEVANLQSDLRQVKYDKNNLIEETKSLRSNNKELSDKVEESDKIITDLKKEIQTSRIKATVTSSTTNATVNQVIRARATAYGSSVRNGGAGTGKTATGVKPQEGVTIAADPRKIPLGTRVRIECPTYPSINGEYIVQDVGGAIKGNKVDIYMDDSKRPQMLEFGKREVLIYVLS
ncbi:Cell wall-binding protein YocH precursor [compost metagenome]